MASVGTVSVVSTAMVALALTSQGQPTADLHLDDSGVWVTRADGAQLGRFNTQAQALDATIVGGSPSVDVLQQGSTVLAVDPSLGTVSPVDVANARLLGTGKLPPKSQVALAGQSVAVLDADGGHLWVLPAAGAASFDETAAPVLKVTRGAVVEGGLDGTFHVADPGSGRLVTVTTTANGTADKVSSGALKGVAASDAVTVTAVGAQAVVLDATTSTLLLPDGGTVTVDGAGPVLQQPSSAARSVVYETAQSLVTQPLDGGAASVRSAGGRAVAPVQVAGCVYGAWSGTGQVVRDCAGTADDTDQVLKGLDASSTLRYRVNRSNVVLNDLASGTLWLAAKNFEKVQDWELKVPENAKGEKTDAETDTPEQVDQPAAKDRTHNHPPDAKDDTFGVRPGRATILPVLGNDVDPDGDVMAAAVDGEGPTNATVAPVMGGDALLATTDADASGSSTFRYVVTDGRGGSATAAVHLSVVPYSHESNPVQTGEPVLTLVKGGTGTIKVLPYFRDPDGDDLYLAAATAKARDDEVRFQPDGTVEYRDAGESTGRKAVSLTIGDGIGGTVEGTLWVDVKGPGNQPPVAVGDHAVTRPGQPVTVYPLRNDTDPNGDALRLAKVEQPAGSKVTPNYDGGSFQLVADKPGTYVTTYQVSDGPSVTTGVARVDVVDPDKASGPPVAAPDTALLPSGGQTLVDVTANDSDPAGGVLVVQSVQVPDDAGVTVAVLGHSVLRITETRHLNEPVTLHYTVSNGTATAVGQVRVVPVPPPVRLHPPNAAADEATVRVGDVVTIPVLANDTHPDGLALFLQPKLARGPSASQGQAFVSGQVVRFQASEKPGTVYLIYRVRDKNGQEDSAEVTIHVLAGAQNSPPKPPTVVARTLSGGSVTITPPLDGTDPDGDSVRLTGIGAPPSKGTAKVTAGTIVYTAAQRATGTDTFEYLVEDRRGLQATGTVRVGIAPPPSTNQPPVAVDDAVTVRPGRAVSVAPLANDSDPDGDRISLVSTLRPQSGVQARADGNLIDLTAPAKRGTVTIFYTVQDARGARASGAVVVTVDDKAPLQPPVAKDDVVSGTDVAGKTAVSVPVLANDSDPDGAASALTVTTKQPGVTVGKGGVLSVPLTDDDQVFAYTVTDPDGLTDEAFVWVPARQVEAPTLRADAHTLTVLSGKPLTVDIRSQVRVADGKAVRLTQASSVKAVNGSRVVVDEHTIRFTSDDKFVGDAYLSFEVTDGKGPGDPAGHVVTLTVRIVVTAPANQPPAFSGIAPVEVGAGDTEPGSVDLAGAATDPDEDDRLTFATTTVSPGLHADLDDDGTLHVTADADVAKGTTGTVGVTVSDGHHPPVKGTVDVTVVASTRHLPVAVEDDVDKAAAGQELSVPVLANDTDPFADEGKPLTLLSADLVSGDASQPVIRGDQVVLTPDKDFHGQIAVRYTVQDATKDPDRQVDGQLLITVQGHPDAPAKPVIGTIESHQVTLSWTPPNNNGSDITAYTVTPSGADPQECVTTTCTITGLTNDTEYTFTVVAHNAVGASDASVESDPARPDERPDAPAAPTLEFGDGSLTVTWTNQTYTDRSAIESVNLQISPTPPDGIAEKQGVTGTSLVWDGLENGVAYTVQVQAVNKAPQPSDWGAPSAEEVPAGKPAAPAKPTVTRTSIGTTSQMQVAWVPPDDNGGDLTGYDIDVLQGDTTVKTVTAEASDTSATIDVPADTTDYTFRVRAKNKATEKFGDADWSPVTDPVRAFAKPSAVGGLTATATGTNSQVTLDWQPATGQGLAADEITYEYTACGGGWTATSSTSATVTCGNNGTEYTYQVRAVPNVEGLDETNAGEATSAKATPFGPPKVPGVSATGNDTTVTVSWSDPGSNGHAYSLQISVDGGGWETVSGGGSRTVGNGHSQTHSIKARTIETGNSSRTAESGTAQATSAPPPPPPPPPSATVSQGPHHKLNGNDAFWGYGVCTVASCAELHLEIRNSTPNNAFTYTCHATETDAFSTANKTKDASNNVVRTDGDGNYTGNLNCVYGWPSHQVWVTLSISPGETNHYTWPNS